jgi:hypothetical protein
MVPADRGLVTVVVVMLSAFVGFAFMAPVGFMTPVRVRRRLGSLLIHLALKNQRSDPNGLDNSKNERSNEPRDNSRKCRLTNHKNSVAGESSAVPGIVRSVMHRRQWREAYEVHETEPQNQGQGSDDSPILRQGRGA